MIDFPTYVTCKRGENTKKGELKPTADALSRWSSRILPRGLHTMGQDGATQYLADYGRGIAAPKCIALAVACEANGFGDIAMGFWIKAFELETGIRPFPLQDFSVPKSAIPIGVDISLPVGCGEPKSSPFPSHLRPGRLVTMQPVDAKYPRQHYIDDASYLGQAKKNGRRMVSFGNGDMVSYQSRSTKVWSAPNVKLHSYLTTLTKEIGPFIIDGELLYYSFDGSEHRTGAQAAIVNMNAGQGHIQPVCEYALFECLYYSGVDLTTTAKLDRIETLGELVFELRKIDPDNQAHAVALQTFYTQEEKAFLANYQKTHHCEGEVWTHKYATYTGGKDLKNEVVLRTKYKIDIKAVIMGLTPTTADGRPFGAIEVGVVEAGHVKPIGSVGTGYTVAQMWDIYHKVNGSLPLTVYIDIKAEGFTEYGQVSQGTFEGFADEEE